MMYRQLKSNTDDTGWFEFSPLSKQGIIQIAVLAELVTFIQIDISAQTDSLPKLNSPCYEDIRFFRR